MVDNLRKNSTCIKLVNVCLLYFPIFPGRANHVSNQITTQAKNGNRSSWYVRGLEV